MSDVDNSPVARLSGEILADARRKAGRTQKKADRESKKITADARKQADAIVEHAMVEARERAERECRTLLASVPLDILRHRLAGRQDVLTDIRNEAESLAASSQADRRYRVLCRLAQQAVEAIGGSACVVALSEADGHAFGPQLLDDVGRQTGCELRPAEPAAAIKFGVIVRSADGKKLYDNSLAARFDRLWDELRIDVGNRVFPTP